MQGTSSSYVIVGAGAIGGTLGHHLARAGHEVTVVDADAEHVRAIRERGIVVRRGDERTAVPMAQALTPGERGPERVSRVLLAVKAQATGAALDWIEPRLADDGFVVSMQNGLNEQAIAARVGTDRTVGAFVNLFADVVGPGEIRDGGLGALVVGELDGRDSERVRQVVADLQAWGPAQATGNVHGYLWSKLGFGAMLVATALADAPMAELIDRHRAVMHALAAQVYAVAAAEGIVLEPFDAFDPAPYASGDLTATDAATDALVAWLRTQAKDRSGIWRDIAVRRRPTEVPTHYGPVLDRAAQLGIAVPGLERLVAQISELEAGAPMGEQRIGDLARAVVSPPLPPSSVPSSVPQPSALDGVDVPALRSWLADHRDDLVTDLVAYAEKETPSDDAALLRAGLAHVEDWVTDRLGAPRARVLHESSDHGDVLVLEYDGAGDEVLTVLAHYDTVWSAGTLADRPVQIEGDRLTGPGVFDMKAGLVQAVWAVRALRAAGLPHPPLRLLLNGDEEIGSPFSRPLIEKACADAVAVLVFEAAADGAVKTARKGVGLWDVLVRGVESHAGLDPTAGASAIDEIARVVRTLHAATDLDGGTTVNVGVLRGGTRSNVVAGSAEASVDVRVRSTAGQARIDGLMRSLHAHDPRATITVHGGWNRPAMERSPAIASVYALARAAAAQLGVDLAETSVGGASDGNFAAAMGRPVLDGLGAVGGGAHARHEHVSIEGMVERAAIAAGVIIAFAR